jgi:hypothetical protein
MTNEDRLCLRSKKARSSWLGLGRQSAVCCGAALRDYPSHEQLWPRGFHPFRAPAPKPTTMYFWMRKNTANTGVRITRPAAMIIPQSTTEAL